MTTTAPEVCAAEPGFSSADPTPTAECPAFEMSPKLAYAWKLLGEAAIRVLEERGELSLITSPPDA